MPYLPTAFEVSETFKKPPVSRLSFGKNVSRTKKTGENSSTTAFRADFCHPRIPGNHRNVIYRALGGEKGECERHSSDWSEQERVNKSKPCIPKFVVRIRVRTSSFINTATRAPTGRCKSRLPTWNFSSPCNRFLFRPIELLAAPSV